jgi:hypothetical protein
MFTGIWIESEIGSNFSRFDLFGSALRAGAVGITDDVYQSVALGEAAHPKTLR